MGDDEGLAKALGELEDELAKGVDEGKISTDAAAALNLAMLELLTAFQEEGALVEVASPTPAPTVVDEGNEDDGNGEGEGPPEHANNDKDED